MSGVHPLRDSSEPKDRDSSRPKKGANGGNKEEEKNPHLVKNNHRQDSCQILPLPQLSAFLLRTKW